MKIFQLILQNIHRKQNLNPTSGLHFRNPFLWIMCIESGNENDSTVSNTNNLNYLEISKPNIQGCYLTCAFQTNIWSQELLINYFEREPRFHICIHCTVCGGHWRNRMSVRKMTAFQMKDVNLSGGYVVACRHLRESCQVSKQAAHATVPATSWTTCRHLPDSQSCCLPRIVFRPAALPRFCPREELTKHGAPHPAVRCRSSSSFGLAVTKLRSSRHLGRGFTPCLIVSGSPPEI